MGGDLIIRDLRDPTGSGQRDWWAAYCTRCAAYVTKFDESAEQARTHGETHLAEAHGVLALVSA